MPHALTNRKIAGPLIGAAGGLTIASVVTLECLHFGSLAGVLLIAYGVYVVAGYATSFIAFSVFPPEKRRGRWFWRLFVAVTFATVALSAAVSFLPCPYVLSGSVGSLSVHLDHVVLEMWTHSPEATEHDKVYHHVDGYVRFEVRPLFIWIGVLMPIAAPMLVELANARFRWRTPIHHILSERQSARRRARGLCPICEYDMRGSATEVCPECGILTGVEPVESFS